MSAPPQPPVLHSTIDPTDIAAMILFVIWSVRRLDIRMTEPEHNPHVPQAVFTSWKQQALSAYSFAARACIVKVAANVAWYFGARGKVSLGTLAMVGLGMFVAWIVAVTLGWRRISNAGRVAERLGIHTRKRGQGRGREEEAGSSRTR